MARTTVRRARVLRCHRRPGLQADLPGAPGAGPARPSRRADDRRGPLRLDLEQLQGRGRARASSSTAASTPAAFAKLCGAAALRGRRLRRPRHLRAAARGAGRPPAAAALPGDPAQPVRHRGRRGPGRVGLRQRRPRRGREAVRPRPRLGPGAQRAPCTSSSPSRPSSASTTISARSRCRTCSTSASPTPSSSRSGTATTSRACRSPWPRTSACEGRGQVLRGGRRDPRRGAEPPAPGGGAARDGAAVGARHRGRPRREGAGVPRRCARSSRPTSCAASSRGYRQEPGVAPDSQVETFAAVRLHIDSWRWAGRAVLHPRRQVPAGDRHRGAGRAQAAAAGAVRRRRAAAPPNHFRFRLSPHVVLALGARAKLPGEAMAGEDVELIACHEHGRRDGALRAAAGRRDARRPDRSSRGRTRWRRRGAWWTRCSGTATTPLGLLRARHLGAGGGRLRCIDGDRRLAQARSRSEAADDGAASDVGVPVRRRQHAARQRPRHRRPAAPTSRASSAPTAAERYWAIFEQLRASSATPTTSARCSATGSSEPRDPRAAAAISSFLLDYPFADRLYPGALDVLEQLGASRPDGRSCPTATWCSSRARSSARASGDAVGRPRPDLHPQGAGAGRRRAPLPGRPLRAGRRQAPHPDGDEAGLGAARHHRLRPPGPLRPRSRACWPRYPPAD